MASSIQQQKNSTTGKVRQRSTKYSSDNGSSYYNSSEDGGSSYACDVQDFSSQENDVLHNLKQINGHPAKIWKTGQHRASETIYSETDNENPDSRLEVDNTTNTQQNENEYYAEEESPYVEDNSGGSSLYYILGCLGTVAVIAIIAACVFSKKHNEENSGHDVIVVQKGESSVDNKKAGTSCCCCVTLIIVAIAALTGSIIGCVACCCWCSETASDAPWGEEYTCAQLEVYNGGDEYYCPTNEYFNIATAGLWIEAPTLDNFQNQCCVVESDPTLTMSCTNWYKTATGSSCPSFTDNIDSATNPDIQSETYSTADDFASNCCTDNPQTYTCADWTSENRPVGFSGSTNVTSDDGSSSYWIYTTSSCEDGTEPSCTDATCDTYSDNVVRDSTVTEEDGGFDATIQNTCCAVSSD